MGQIIGDGTGKDIDVFSNKSMGLEGYSIVDRDTGETLATFREARDGMGWRVRRTTDTLACDFGMLINLYGHVAPNASIKDQPSELFKIFMQEKKELAGKPSRTVRKVKPAAIVAELSAAIDDISTLRDCCTEALTDEWDRSDQGFIDMREQANKRLRKLRSLLKKLEGGIA